MAQTGPTIAGFRAPAGLAVAVKALIVLLALAFAWQVTRLTASESRAPAPAKASPAAPAQAQRAAPPGPGGPAIRHLNLDRPLRHGDYAWDEAGAPPGRIRILVDLGRQTLFVFRGNHEIGRAVILYGTDEQPTPLGTFPIIEKDEDHVSNLYDAIMPWMLRLTNDGIAIHGSNVRYGWASRGCIGVPDEFAAQLFAQARLGDEVTVINSARASTAA
jgi:lipoprotein-anchoring transpeptidase ErfK/SrfK